MYVHVKDIGRRLPFALDRYRNQQGDEKTFSLYLRERNTQNPFEGDKIGRPWNAPGVYKKNT